MEDIQVKVKGYKIYAETQDHELYDFFIPREQYKLSMKEAKEQVPELHKVIAVKRDTQTYYVTFDDLKTIKLYKGGIYND